MGYSTEYTLEYDTLDDHEDIKDFILKSTDHLIGFEVEALLDGGTLTAQWYEHEEEMLNLSRGFPATIFILYGIGSEQGDMWKKRFINGGVEIIRATLVFPDFEPLPEEHFEV
jgi:hypothetical protein